MANGLSRYGNALTAAAYDGTTDIIDMLLTAGADLHAPTGWPLQTAAAEGHEDIVKQFLARGADVNAFTQNAKFPAGTALQGACDAGWVDMARLLLEHGADPNLGGGDDGPPIIAATRLGESEILRLLVTHGADLNVGRGSGDASTPLINAAWRHMDGESLRLLLDHGADVDGADGAGITALMAACVDDHVEAARMLLDHGADLLRANRAGKTALQVALKNEANECLALLVGQTSALFAALRAAVEGGNRAVAALVRGAGAHKQGLDYGEDSAAVVSASSPGPDGGEQDDEGQDQHVYSQPGALDRPPSRENEARGYGLQEPRPPHQFQPAYADAEDRRPQFGAQAGPGWQHWAETPETPQQQYSPGTSNTSSPPFRAQAQPYPLVPGALAIRRKPTPSMTRPSVLPDPSLSPSLSPAPASGGGYFPARATPPSAAPTAGLRRSYLPYDPRVPSSPSPPGGSFARPPAGPPPALAPKPAAYAAAAAAAGGGGGSGYRGDAPPLPYRAPPPWARDTGHDDRGRGSAG